MINLKGEHWRDNLLGETLDYRLKKAIIDRQHKEALSIVNNMHESAFVAVTNPKTKKIKDIGFSIPEDLILDNFGRLLSAIMCPPINYVTAHSSALMTATTGVAYNVGIYYYIINQAYEYNEGVGYTYIKLGSGSTTPARTDYDVETALGAAPENGGIWHAGGNYAAGKVALGGATIASGSGTLSEMGLFLYCKALSSGNFHFMLFHDQLASPVTYVATDKITTVYSVAI